MSVLVISFNYSDDLTYTTCSISVRGYYTTDDVFFRSKRFSTRVVPLNL